MAPVIANYFDQITPAGNGQYHNSLLLSALDANSVVFNNMTYSCLWSCSIDEDLETICIMGLAQPALGYWQASYQAPPTATGDLSKEATTGVAARLSNKDENEWQDYSLQNSGAA